MIEEFVLLDGNGQPPGPLWLNLSRVVMAAPHFWKGRTVTAAYLEINKGLVLDIEPEKFVNSWRSC